MKSAYEGTERRRHRVYITRNTEYHVRDGANNWAPGPTATVGDHPT